jgi:hypothetical protein
MLQIKYIKFNQYQEEYDMTMEEMINHLFIAVDLRDWSRVKECFAEKLVLDYSSMNGQPAAELTAEDIIAGWKYVLPGFTCTHHQLGNMIIKAQPTEAAVFCYGTASHYLEHEKGNVWIVVGSYDFNLKMVQEEWKITKMKFNYKYQDGNKELPALALEKATKAQH